MGNLYVIRHGQTTCNADQVIQGPRIDSELSDLGLQQADALADAFEETPLDALYVSPMRRARQTADALVGHHAADLAEQMVPELYEMDYGELCGRALPDVQPVIDRVLDAWELGFVDHAFPGGESPVLAQWRIRALAHRLREAAVQEDIAVVAHGRINRILIATLLQRSLQQINHLPQHNANITHLAVSLDGVALRRLDDTRHLDTVPDAFS